MAQKLLLWNKGSGVIERLYSNYKHRQSIHKDSIKNINLDLLYQKFVRIPYLHFQGLKRDTGNSLQVRTAT